MSKEIHLFDRNEMTIKFKFYILMDILVSNQGSGSRMESIILFTIFFLQFLTGFFNQRLNIYDSTNSESDLVINYIQRIVRLRDIITFNASCYHLTMLILYIILIVFSLYLLIMTIKTNKASFYSYPNIILNCGIKLFIYIAFPILLDLSFGVFCFKADADNTSPSFLSESIYSQQVCDINIGSQVIIAILLLYSVLFSFFIQQFYTDSLFLSTSYYSKMACGYDIYMTIHTIIYSILLMQSPVVGSLLFIVYNIVASGFFLGFYYSSFIFYDHISNMLHGLFFMLYFYLSVFSLLVKYITINEKGLIYVLSALLFIVIFNNLRDKIEAQLMLRTPFYKLNNRYALLYYFKSLIEKINIIDQDDKERALLIGIIQTHIKECPIEFCITKHTESIYLPSTNQWSNRDKPFHQDKVFLLNYVLSIMKFYVNQNLNIPEIIINLSLYYLIVIGNYCQSILCYTKVKSLTLSLQDHFSFIRLHNAISKKMVEKLKQPNESCFHLEDLNVSFYFKYDNLSQKFYSEINTDVSLSLEFWRCFKRKDKEPIDFNYIFKLTDSIRKTKQNVELLWEELYKQYNGVNELFDIYLSYIECINDDDVQKRVLESIKRKAENSADNIQMNYYNILFNKETGIIIANGDKGREGVIEKTNKEIETIFSFKMEELKGMNISSLMPKLFALSHAYFMERFVQIGEKKIIDNTDFKTFAKDKDNSIFLIRKSIKLLPMLNQSIFFVALIVKEKIDDIIFIDSKFNIQGMSSVLMKKLMINNMDLFQENEIPFYVICKKFVNFNRIFLQGKKKGNNCNGNDKERKKPNQINPIAKKMTCCINSTTIINLERLTSINEPNVDIDRLNEHKMSNSNSNNNLIACNNKDTNGDDDEEDDMHDNIEINENIELEYEIKIPQFLYGYARAMRANTAMFSPRKTQEEAVHRPPRTAQFPYEDFNEEDLLINEEKKNNSQYYHKSTNKYKESSYNIIDTPQYQSTKDIIKHDDEKREFDLKISKHRELFEEGLYNELEDYIDACTMNTSLEFKFNFTFDKYKYGDRQMVFVIRCIDKLSDTGNANEDSEKGVVEDDLLALKRTKWDSLEPLIELFPTEEEEIKDEAKDYLTMASENIAFKKSLTSYKEEINRYSRIHGNQKDTVIADDEQGSQASLTGFNENLCKKNRIEEIRANVMKNVSNFYTLNYIKGTVILFLLLTLAFVLIFMVKLCGLYRDLNEVSDLNIKFYKVIYWMSTTISSLISLRTLFTINQEGLPFEFKSYIEDHDKYFEHLRTLNLKWNQIIEGTYGMVEEEIGNFISADKSSFWDSYRVEYTVKGLGDTESLPLSVSQVLTNINNLLRNKAFTYKGAITDANELDKIDYASHMSIENAYNNLFPVLYDKIRVVPVYLQEYNEKSMTIFIIIIVLYGVFIFIGVSLYALSIYLTNRNMGESLEKITHIRSEKIEETIKKIEQFSQSLFKYFKKDTMITDPNANNTYINPYLSPNLNGNGNSNNGNTHPAFKIDELRGYDTPSYNYNHKDFFNDKNRSSAGSSSDGFSSEGKKHKQLKILYASYTQIIILFADIFLFLVLIYFYTLSMIEKTNQMITLERYYLGQTLMLSSNTLDIKCQMAECDVNLTSFQFSDLVTQEHFTQMIQVLTVFNQFSEFYTKSYSVDACITAFNANTIEYDQCLEDPIIKAANNTPALIKVIEDKIYFIKKEFSLYRNDPSYRKMQTYGSQYFFDLEYVFYNYMVTVNNRFATIMMNSLVEYLDETKLILMILIVLFCVTIIACMAYTVFFFLRKLINLLSVSRCIMRIIPTIVIFNTPELEAWIENKYA